MRALRLQLFTQLFEPFPGETCLAKGIFSLASATGFEGHVQAEALQNSRSAPKFFNRISNFEELLNVGRSVAQEVFVLTEQSPSTACALVQRSDKFRSEFRFETGNFCLGAGRSTVHWVTGFFHVYAMRAIQPTMLKGAQETQSRSKGRELQGNNTQFHAFGFGAQRVCRRQYQFRASSGSHFDALAAVRLVSGSLIQRAAIRCVVAGRCAGPLASHRVLDIPGSGRGVCDGDFARGAAAILDADGVGI